MYPLVTLPKAWQPFVDERLSRLTERCREEGISLYDDAGVTEHLERVLLTSDFAFDSFFQNPHLLGPQLISLMNDPRTAEARATELTLATDEISQLSLLRRFRRREALRLIWRDVNGLDDVIATLHGSSALAEACLQTALRWSESALIERYGLPRNAAGAVQRVVVLALGKLGGNELNFSSDIDLILSYPENGTTDGPRVVDNEAFFLRLAQQLVRMLSEVTSDGYVCRVDLRLRPFGHAGRLVLSFVAMESYYQREGRDWERYAWIKARPIAGDLHAGKRLIDMLRPFVYRRYLDYTAFAGLREMKALIDAEVIRKDRTANLKLGPGGIREIEFIVQLVQLIRGGREPSLRVQGLLPALRICEQRGFLSAEKSKSLCESYLFLRRLENRLQMLRDEQIHELPNGAILRERYAVALGYDSWSALEQHLAAVRTIVSKEFTVLISPRNYTEDRLVISTFWRRCVADMSEPGELAALGFNDAEKTYSSLLVLIKSSYLRQLSERSRQHFNELMPHLLEAAAATSSPDNCLDRLLRLVHTILKRPSYLALLHEQPLACQRVVDLFAKSEYLAEQVIAHPLLLDELLDQRLEITSLNRLAIESEIERRLSLLEDPDIESQLEILQEEKQSISFRLGLAYLINRIEAVQVARMLSHLAEAIVASILKLAEADVADKYGCLNGYSDSGSGLGIIGYGSLGGTELSFSSDLDLIFIYNSTLDAKETSGPKPLDGARYFARLAQRVVHFLTTLTSTGRLYEVDVRLRPDGGKGLLVIHLDAFIDYQRKRAWIWEHQALIRASFIAGHSRLKMEFTKVRNSILQQTRDACRIRKEVEEMRTRWRSDRDRSNTTFFDLKQGAGGLVDIEFLLQALILLNSSYHPDLLMSTHTADLIFLLEKMGIFTNPQALGLYEAYGTLLTNALSCTLDKRSRLVVRSSELESYCEQVLRVAHEHGLNFSGECVDNFS